MARNVADKAAAKAGELTQDQRDGLLFHHTKSYEMRLAAKKKADADFKNACKLARADVGADAVERVKTIIALRTPEGEAKIKAHITMQLDVSRAVAAPLTNQMELGLDRTPVKDRAFNEGKRDGLAGSPAAPTWAKGTPEHLAYANGHQEGQAILAKGFRRPTALEKAAAAGPATAAAGAPKAGKGAKGARKAGGAANDPAKALATPATPKGKGAKGASLTLVKTGGGAADRVKELAAKAGAKPH